MSPVTFYLSTVIEISDGMLVRATCPRFKPSRELMTHLGGRGALLLRCPTGFWRLQEALATLVAATGVLLRFQTAQRFLAAPIVAELPLLTFPGTSWRHRELRRWGIPGETIADCGFRLPKGFRGGDHASCAKWSETEPKSSFSRGSRPGPPAGIPAPLGHLTWPRRGRFRVLLGATLLPDGCPVGVRRQVWTAQGGLKPP